MKKIILNSNILWTIIQFRKDLIIELQKTYEVICIADSDDFLYDSLQVSKNLNIEYIQISIDRKGVNPFIDIMYFVKLYKIYSKIKPDLVIHYTIKPNIYGSLACRLLNIKSFAVVSGLGSSFIRDGFITKIVKYLYSWALKDSKKVIFLNNDDLNIFIEHNIIQKHQALQLPGEGVDVNFYQTCKKEEDKSLTFLMVARLLKDKGIYEYIYAIKAIKTKKNVKFLLAGVLDEDNATSIKQYELDKWIEDGVIEYIGTKEDVKDFFKLADVVVLPSYREGMSRILLEACSCEKFIIASNIAGCKELCIDGKNGYLCETKSTESLKNAIEKTLNLSRTDLINMGKNGRDLVVNNYSTHIVNKIYKKIIKEFI